MCYYFFFFNDTATTEIYTLSLHDALPIYTSPNQVRVMERTEAPVRVVVPGRCYRYEAQDASHEWMFYQVEGLAVDVGDRKSTRLNSSHANISYAVFCLKKKKKT